MSALYLTPLFPGSPQSPTVTVLVPLMALRLKRSTSWRSRVKAFATSCGLWTALLRATSSWRRWIHRGLTMGAGTWSLREGWKLDWPDRQCWSTQGHKSRNECTRTLGLAVPEKHLFIKWFLALLLSCFVKSEVYSNILLPQYHLEPYTQGAHLCSMSTSEFPLVMDNSKDSKAYDMFQTEVVT